MKLEIIHLSDFHINKSFNHHDYINKIIDSIIIDDSSISKKIVLCITGDLANSGHKSQYKIFDLFLSELKEKIEDKGKELILYFVPGNHDISLPKDEERMPMLEHAIATKEYGEILENDIKNMSNFFEFAGKYELFEENKYVCIKTLNVEDKKIQFNLLNTACLSLRSKNDKEKHYIPIDFLNINIDTSLFNITLMHHSNEWFNEECEYPLDYLLENSSMYLFGHQHKTTFVTKKDSYGFLATEVDLYKLNNNPFNIFVLDFDNESIKQLEVKYDVLTKKYIRENFNNCKIYPTRIFKKNKYNKNNEEMKYVDVNLKKYDIDKCFVMPLLTTDEDDKTIMDFVELMNYINSNKFINIQGYNKGGKTTLIKKIFNEYKQTNKYIFYVNSLAGITNNCDQSLKHIFIDNYDDIPYDDFLQENKENKIIIFDNSSLLSDRKNKSFLDFCKQRFDIVIFTSDFAYNNRKELIYENSLEDFSKIKIEPFTLKQRHKLAENISIVYNQKESINNIIKCVESVINNDTFIDLTNPNNLAQLLDSLIKDRLYEERDTKNSFSIIFEHNIVNMIRSNISESEVDASIAILNEIAYFMFKKEEECYKITYNELQYIFTESKNKWRLRIERRNFDNMLINSKIMKEEDCIYQFSKNSYYSYFVANRIVKYQHKVEFKDDIYRLINNITFGNYSDILLFITYFIKDLSFFENIMKYINDTIEKWKIISFDEKNNYILKRIKKEGTTSKENFENKISHKNRRDKAERRKIETYEKESNEEKNKEVKESEFNESIKILKLIEILSKAINGYSGILEASQRGEMINTTRKGLYSLIYKVFDLSDEEYEEIYNDIEIKNEKKDKDERLDSEELKKLITNIFYQTLIIFTLNIISGVANIMVSVNSIDLISEIYDRDENNNIIFDNVLFKTICFERYGKDTKFVDYLINVYKDIKKIEQQDIIKRIFRMFVISSSISNVNIERICKLMEIDKKKILMLNPDNKEKLTLLTNKIKEK